MAHTHTHTHTHTKHILRKPSQTHPPLSLYRHHLHVSCHHFCQGPSSLPCSTYPRRSRPSTADTSYSVLPSPYPAVVVFSQRLFNELKIPKFFPAELTQSRDQETRAWMAENQNLRNSSSGKPRMSDSYSFFFSFFFSLCRGPHYSPLECAALPRDVAGSLDRRLHGPACVLLIQERRGSLLGALQETSRRSLVWVDGSMKATSCHGS